MPKKQDRSEVTLRLEPELAEKFRDARYRRGDLKAQTALTQALLMWLASGDSLDVLPKGPFGDLTTEEEWVLKAVLGLLRDQSVPRDDPSSVKPSLLAMGKRAKRNRE